MDSRADGLVVCQAPSRCVPAIRINAIVLGQRGVSADTDLRLTRYLGLSVGYSLRPQNVYRMMEARRTLGDGVEKVKVRAG